MRSAFARWNHVNGSLLCLEWDGRQKAPCGDCRKASKGAARAVGLKIKILSHKGSCKKKKKRLWKWVGGSSVQLEIKKNWKRYFYTLFYYVFGRACELQ